jgi:hypothetical protein
MNSKVGPPIRAKRTSEATLRPVKLKRTVAKTTLASTRSQRTRRISQKAREAVEHREEEESE